MDHFDVWLPKKTHFDVNDSYSKYNMLYCWEINHNSLKSHSLLWLVTLSMQYTVDFIRFLLTVVNVNQCSLSGSLKPWVWVKSNFACISNCYVWPLDRLSPVVLKKMYCSYFRMPTTPLHSEWIFSAVGHM